ncbi:MAG: Na(+)-translocating NADH-quinone reductase subunit A [Myxococcota bacterium]|nr:Na(+)-translocating NADH-quinone reductase subunit A [Myxococcota bacterium]
MALHKIHKGLDLPIEGAPIQVVRKEVRPQRIALMADDFPGMKPAMRVKEGESVKRGQVLFEDRKNPGVLHTAAGAGRVIGVNRGARRTLQSVVIDLSPAERSGEVVASEVVSFESYAGKPAESLSPGEVRALLIESGEWTALRTRPYSKVPAIDAEASALFVTAMDTNPLAPLPEVVLAGREADFDRGLHVLSKLTAGITYLCVSPDSGVERGVTAPVRVENFAGPHPSGTVGLHIHTLEPVSRGKSVWHVGYPDVIAIGALFATGKLDVERIVAVGGPPVSDPRLLRTRRGADTEVVAGEQWSDEEEVRLIAGSVLSGKKAMGDVFGYLGRYDRQLSVVREGRERTLLGWLTPGLGAFSVFPIYLSKLFSKKRFAFSTATNGSPRTMVPIGMYEDIMPLDILPTFLLRSLIVADTEQAEKLGALELDEEDLALCTFVCPGKTNYGPILRANLEILENEG